MRALRLSGTPTLAEITLSEVETPTPGPGEVLIRLKNAALNHRDLYFFNGRVIDPPSILGSDGSGVVESVGGGVSGWQPGDEVILYPSLNWGDSEDHFGESFEILGVPSDGTFAEYLLIGQEYVFARPSWMSFEQAAALPLAGLTAYRALFSRSDVQPGEHVLIHGIGGSVSVFALQFAKAIGAQVAVTSRHDAKLEQARELGADQTINASEDWVEVAKEWSGGKGVDLVVENIGDDYFSRSLHALRHGGRMVTFGRSKGSTSNVEVGLIYWNHLQIIGTTMGSPADFEGLLAFVETHQVEPVIDSVWPLSDVRGALQFLHDGKQAGKVVLDCTK